MLVSVVKKTQKILLYGFHLVFEKFRLQKKSVYILKPCRETGKCFEETLRGDKVVKNLKIKQLLLDPAFV